MFIDEDFIRTENGKTVSTNLTDYMKFSAGPFSPPPIVAIRDVVVSKDKAFFYWTSQKPKRQEPLKDLEISNNGFSVWTFNTQGKAIHEDAFYDELALRQQMGFTLQPPDRAED